MLSNKEFLGILHKCSKGKNVEEMDQQLNKMLCNTAPYDLVFKEANTYA